MKESITMSEIMTCSTWSKKDNSPRGCKTVSNTEIKPGDKVVYKNRFTLVIADEEQEQEQPAKVTTATALQEAAELIKARKDRSAWDKGVTAYALELLQELAELAEGGDLPADAAELLKPRALREKMLNGAANWKEYSWGGSGLIYDGDIAKRLCCPSELKRTRNGERRPNSSEEWLDVQARALYQAGARVFRAFVAAMKEAEV